MSLIELSGVYVKVDSNNNLLLYPYTEASLKEENPYTKYNFAKRTYVEWYYLTEDCLENNNEIKQVYTYQEMPECEINTTFVQNTEPTFNEVEGKWVFDYTCVPMTEEEIALRDNGTGPSPNDELE